MRESVKIVLRWCACGHTMNFSQAVELNGEFIFQSTPERARAIAERIRMAMGLWNEIEILDLWTKEGDQQGQQR